MTRARKVFTASLGLAVLLAGLSPAVWGQAPRIPVVPFQNFNELTWPQAQQIIINQPSFPDPLGGKSRDSFISSAPPNITVMSNDQVNPYAHQFNAGVNRSIARDIAITADLSIVNRYSDRDTIDPKIRDLD